MYTVLIKDSFSQTEPYVVELKSLAKVYSWDITRIKFSLPFNSNTLRRARHHLSKKAPSAINDDFTGLCYT